MPRGAVSTADEQSKPRPGRYHHLKRLALAFAGLMVFLFVVRLWWGWEAHRRLQAEIDRIVARGEPIYPEDFDPPEETPDDQNAALAFIKAAQQMNTTAKQDEIISGSVDLWEITPEQWNLINDFETNNRASLELIRQARLKTTVDWGIRFRSPAFQAITAILPNLSRQRQLCRVLCAVAMANHYTGDDAVAMETLRDVLFLAEALDQIPSTVSFLTSEAIVAMAVKRLEFCTPDLIVDWPGGANRSLIDAVMANLLDEEAPRRALLTAMYAERMYQVDTVRLRVGGDLGPSALAWVGAVGPASAWERAVQFPVTPLYEVDAALMIQDMDQIIQACGWPSWPEAYEILGPLDKKWEKLLMGSGQFRRPMSRFLFSTQSRVALIHFRYLAKRRMAAIALAIRLYEIHHGRRPAALAVLVPEYLDEVPRDPMDPDGATFRYLPEAEIPVLYSIGENGIDDGGLWWDEKRGNYDRHNRLDIVFLLDGVLPDPPP